MRNWIRHRHNCFKPENPLLITLHHTSPIWPLPLRILHIVTARTIRFPDINSYVWDRLARNVFDSADAETGLPAGVGGHAFAVGDWGRLVRVEGPEDGAFGAGGGFGVVDCVDEEGEAEDIGEEDEFLHQVISFHSFLLWSLPFMLENSHVEHHYLSARP
jgi:hypothetical protein